MLALRWRREFHARRQMKSPAQKITGVERMNSPQRRHVAASPSSENPAIPAIACPKCGLLMKVAAIEPAGNDDRTVRFWDSTKGQLRGVIMSEPEYVVYLTTDGLWKVDPQKQVDLVYVAQIDQGQVALAPEEFASRFRWKNNPAKVKMVTR